MRLPSLSACKTEYPLHNLHVLWWLWTFSVTIFVVIAVISVGGKSLYATSDGMVGAGATFTLDRAVVSLFLALFVVGYQMWLLRSNLSQNYRRGEGKLLPTLGWGNRLTLARGLAYPLMAGFLFAPRPDGWMAWAPALLYLCACIVDYLDGYLARITNHVTVLGEVLDMEFDGLGAFLAITLAVQYGQLPAIYLFIALGRQLFVLGMSVRERMGLPNHPMTDSSIRRVIAGAQMGFAVVLLWPIVGPPATHIAGAIFGGALVLSFGRDWAVVAGWIDPSSERYQRTRRFCRQLVLEWLPPVLRCVLSLVGGWILWRAATVPDRWLSLVSHFDSARWILLTLLLGMGALVWVATVSGILGRVTALIWIGIACLDQLSAVLAYPGGLVLASACLWLLIGSGRFSLWTPEERFFMDRLGTQPAPELSGSGR